MAKLSDLSGINPRLNLLLYGPPGGGKTVFSHSFPGRIRTLDFDGGMQSVLWAIKEGVIEKDPSEIEYETFHNPRNPKKGPLIYDAAVKQIDEWLEAEEENEEDAWDTLIIDSGTLLTEHSTIKALKEGARLNISQTWSKVSDMGLVAMRIQDWGNSATLFKKFIMYCLGLDKNVILNCHEYQNTNDAGSVIAIEPKLIGQLRQDIPLFFDEVYYLLIRGNKKRAEYMIQTQRDSLRQCKSRLGCFDATEPTDFEALIKKVSDFYDVAEEEIWMG